MKFFCTELELINKDLLIVSGNDSFVIPVKQKDHQWMAKHLGLKVGGKVYGAGVRISPSETGRSVGSDTGREEESFQLGISVLHGITDK